MMVIRIILTRVTANSSRLRAKKGTIRLQTSRILRSALVSCQTPAGASQSPNDGFQPRIPIGNTSCSKRRFNLFKPKAQTPAKQPRIANVRSAEHRLEVVKKQLVGEVLHIELDIHRNSFISP